jgi:hypothetical protein
MIGSVGINLAAQVSRWPIASGELRLSRLTPGIHASSLAAHIQ